MESRSRVVRQGALTSTGICFSFGWRELVVVVLSFEIVHANADFDVIEVLGEGEEREWVDFFLKLSTLRVYGGWCLWYSTTICGNSIRGDNRLLSEA